MKIEVGKQYITNCGDIVYVIDLLNLPDTLVYVSANGRFYDDNGRNVGVSLVPPPPYITYADKENDIIKEHTPQDFQSQKEIWEWLLSGGAIVHISGNIVQLESDGNLTKDYYIVPDLWKKHIEPQKEPEWYETLNGTLDNAWVCWVTDNKKYCSESYGVTVNADFSPGSISIFIAYDDGHIFGRFHNKIKPDYVIPIMRLSEFKQKYIA